VRRVTQRARATRRRTRRRRLTEGHEASARAVRIDHVCRVSPDVSCSRGGQGVTRPSGQLTLDCNFSSVTLLRVPLAGDVALQAGRSTHPRALRVGFWWSARLVKGAARSWVGLPRGAAVSRSAWRQTAWGGAGALPAALPASGWRVCTCCRDARAAAPALGGLAPGGGGLSAAGAGLNAPWEGFAQRRDAGAAFVSELPYPGRRAPRRPQAVCCCFFKVRSASGCGCGAAWRLQGRRDSSTRRGVSRDTSRPPTSEWLVCARCLSQRACRCAGCEGARNAST
jgi:hypothetical protein